MWRSMLVTTTVPQVRVVSTVGGLATDTAAIVGEAAFEGEVTDSLTNELLGSVVDKRVGTKTFAGVFSSWDDVQAAFDSSGGNTGCIPDARSS